MNIFVTTSDPVKAASYLDDMRVNKMITESLQMLATAMIRHGAVDADLPRNKAGTAYKPSHQKHPCTIWTGDSGENFEWLYLHTVALCNEWHARTGKRQIGDANLSIVSQFLYNMPWTGQTPFVNCTTNFKHIADIHEAYRLQLELKWNNKKEKYRQTWYKSDIFPGWI